MKFLPNQQLTAAIVLSLSVGCASLQSMPGKMKSMVSGKPDARDPLANVKGEVSDDFKTAKRELKSADDTLLKYAQMREDMGNHSVALDRYRELLADNPDNINARLGIARVEYKTGRVHEAEEILKAAARRHPQNLQVWIDIGRIQSERKRYAAAIQSLQKAVDLDSSSQVARFELGLAMARADRFDDAKSHLSFAVGDSAALYNIGYVLHDAGRNQEAVHWFHQALDSYPDDRTRKSATEMIASLEQGTPGNSKSRIARSQRLPSKVDIEQTTFSQWKETPTSEGILSKPRQMVSPASHVESHTQAGNRIQPPHMIHSPKIERRSQHIPPPVVHASRSTAQNPVWRGGSQTAATLRTPALFPVPQSRNAAQDDSNYPPKWNRAQ